MTFKNKKHIIFDLDGTLINSVPDLANAVNTTLKYYKLETLSVEKIASFVGNGVKLLVERSLKFSSQKDITDDFLNEALKIYYNAYKENICVDTYTYPDVPETLEYLKQKGYKMTICTNKPFAFIQPILEKLDIAKYFELWVGEDSLTKKKPDPAPLFYLADKMKIEIKDSIMIGDSKNDILAAKNAKMDSVGLSYGYNYDENIADNNPNFVVDSFAEIKELF